MKQRSRAARFRGWRGATSAGVLAAMSTWTPGADVSAAEPTSEESPTRGEDGKERWIHRWAPERMMGEVGVYGGLIFPSTNLELFEADASLPDQGFQPYNRVAPEIGLRGGFYPLRFVGVEGELGVMPTRIDAGNNPRATMWTLRGHVVGQLGLWSITPFVLVGVGALGVVSDRQAVGTEVDTALHFGGGVKFFINRWIALRLDLRDVVSNERGVADGLTHTGEVLLGVSLTLGRDKKEEPSEPPEEPKDSDGDGFLDDEDMCVDTPGVAPDGCPDSDRDGDGFPDDEDKCPDEPGVEPDGCPRPDRDGDKIADDVDQCPDDPETRNGYKDQDGCPDEVPKEVEEFAGVLSGVEFELNSAAIRPESRAILDRAVDVLNKYSDVEVEIGGHTDSSGSREYNLQLSRRRARAVEKFLVSNGIEAKRLSTRGYGPDKPIASNDTKDGRAQNRRIEFSIVSR